MDDKAMKQVIKFLQEVSHFVGKAQADTIIVHLISGWEIPEGSETEYPFLASKNVSINSGAVTLADVVEREIDDVKSGKYVIVILADNRQHHTSMEYFKCNISKDSKLTPVQIVSKSNAKHFEGGNYHGEEVL